MRLNPERHESASSLDPDTLADSELDAVAGGRFIVERIVTDNKDPDGTYRWR
jgi:hypothetical protein